jgi:2-dehydropantoate 2-reductase
MRIAVFGAGAIGSYYGAGFAKGGAEVHLIARGAHLEALRKNGLTLVSEDGTETLRLPATDDPATIGPVDAVIVAVKSYDTLAVVDAVGPLLRRAPSTGSGLGPVTWAPESGATAVVSLQNGVENEEVIASAIGGGHVIGGSAYIFATIRSPGVVFASGPRDIVLGEWSEAAPEGRLDALVEAARAGGIPVEGVADIRAAKWEKYTLLTALSAMTAGTRLPLGELRRSSAAMAMLRSLMVETWAVGRARGVALDGDVVDRQFARVAGQESDATSSLYGDLVSGHRMEVEALQGYAVRLARTLGVDTPYLDAAYAMLEPWALRNELRADERPPLPA